MNIVASITRKSFSSSEFSITSIDRHYADIMKEREAEMAIETEEKPLEEMNILEMVDYFMEQGMTEEQANDLAHAEWQARKINDEPAMAEAVDESTASGESAVAIEPPVEEEPPVQAPDNGYMPDPSMSIEAMNSYGYMDSDMLPLSKERALELFERDVPIYITKFVDLYHDEYCPHRLVTRLRHVDPLTIYKWQEQNERQILLCRKWKALLLRGKYIRQRLMFAYPWRTAESPVQIPLKDKRRCSHPLLKISPIWSL